MSGNYFETKAVKYTKHKKIAINKYFVKSPGRIPTIVCGPLVTVIDGSSSLRTVLGSPIFEIGVQIYRFKLIEQELCALLIQC